MKATTEALNRALEQLGAFKQPTEPTPPQSFAVSGQVRRDDGSLLPGLTGGLRSFAGVFGSLIARMFWGDPIGKAKAI